MVCSPKEARLKQYCSNQVSSTAASILAAGQVSPDNLLLTLIDPWFVLLKRLDSKQDCSYQVSSTAASILAAGQVGPEHFLLTDRSMVCSSREARLKQDCFKKSFFH